MSSNPVTLHKEAPSAPREVAINRGAYPGTNAAAAASRGQRQLVRPSPYQAQSQTHDILTGERWPWKSESAKDCVTTHLPNVLAQKMGGTLDEYNGALCTPTQALPSPWGPSRHPLPWNSVPSFNPVTSTTAHQPPAYSTSGNFTTTDFPSSLFSETHNNLIRSARALEQIHNLHASQHKELQTRNANNSNLVRQTISLRNHGAALQDQNSTLLTDINELIARQGEWMCENDYLRRELQAKRRRRKAVAENLREGGKNKKGKALNETERDCGYEDGTMGEDTESDDYE
jgi:hypothetical protein